MPLSALAINSTLKRAPADSSCDRLLQQVQSEFQRHGVECPVIRAVDVDIQPGVTSDEGPGDAWPAIRSQVLAADILIMGTPI